MTLSDLLIPFLCLFGSAILIGGGAIFIIIKARLQSEKDWPERKSEFKKKLKGVWQIVWRFLVALLILLMRRTKVVSKKVEHRWCIKKCESCIPEKVSVNYKTKILWYSPLMWIIIILAGLQSIWDSGLRDFIHDNKDVFKWSEEKYMNWTYKPEYTASKLRVKFDIWLLTIIEDL